jgi:RNA polymerase sigma factor (sigma-70 family)
MPEALRRRLDTEDLVHDALLGTLRRIEHLDPRAGGAFQAYTRQALLNGIRDELRRRREVTLPTAAGEAEIDPEPSPLEATIGRNATERYLRALDLLDPDAREAVIARLECHASWAEIAEEFGKESPDAARMMVRRALAQLAREMGPE